MRGSSTIAFTLVLGASLALVACGKSDTAQEQQQPATAAAPKATAYNPNAPAAFNPEDTCRKGIARLTQTINEFNTQNAAKAAQAEGVRDKAEAAAGGAKWDECFKTLDDGFIIVNVGTTYAKDAAAAAAKGK